MQRSSVMKMVVQAVMPDITWVLGRRGYTDTFDQVRAASLQALGIVRAREDLAKNLMASAPHLSAERNLSSRVRHVVFMRSVHPPEGVG